MTVSNHKEQSLLKFIKANNKFWFWQIVLSVLTFLTMTAAGAILQGKYFWESKEAFFTGLPYAGALFFILTCHEMGHYLTAFKYRVGTSLPYYVPFWVPFFNLGTMGAFIKIKEPIPNRKALLDIGLSGPLAGLLATLSVLWYGYATLPDLDGIIAHISQIHPYPLPDKNSENLVLGKSLIIYFFQDIISDGKLPMSEMYHFPYIFAGWVGTLVTAINLMPIGQLDGGHITYALFKDRALYISYTTFVMLMLLNIISINYLIWTLLLFFIVRFKHPPTLNNYEPLNKKRIATAVLGYLIFILSFIPVPFNIY